MCIQVCNPFLCINSINIYSMCYLRYVESNRSSKFMFIQVCNSFLCKNYINIYSMCYFRYVESNRSSKFMFIQLLTPSMAWYQAMLGVSS